MMERYSGVLMPMSSLPSKYGIGTMGRCAYDFVDFLKASGQKYWQLLPLGPTSYGDSPYSSFSTFAGNPYYIDLDMLIEDGLLTQAEVDACWWCADVTEVDYGAIFYYRFPLLRKAFARGQEKYADKIAAFRAENTRWLENYALYMAVKAHFGMVSWIDWPDEDIRMHRPDAVREYTEKLSEDIDFYVFLQYLFFEQWNALRSYAHKNGIEFIGDIPIYVALDSADLWSEPEYFQLDENNIPTEVAGCPPDAFTEDGQLWGNPLYDWERMRADGYGWWIRRIEGCKKLYDVIRIDHFRGFESYWAVPYGDKTARKGRWKPGPGMGLVGILTSWFHDTRFIAENLGFLTDAVDRLLHDSGMPGMNVLEFGFDPNGDSSYMPHNCQWNTATYIGTHDNDTVLGWLDSFDADTIAYARDYMHITEDEGWCWGMIRSGMSTASGLFVMQMQDILELPGDARMNIPGTPSGNWRWRMKPDAVTPELSEKLREYTYRYRRI